MDAATAAAESAHSAIATSVTRLRAARARTEMLAELHTPRGFGPFRRAPKFLRLGEVWRLGVLLLAADPIAGGPLFATGAVTRARDPRHPNFTSVSAEERRAVREAARRAGFAAGQAVDYDARPLPIDRTLGSAGPLVVRDGKLFVSWDRSRAPASLTPFADYLAERVELVTLRE